ncbi:hypothetical protein F4677DRAFT_416235 [Hypoxylon crocopeplum]|nr:hypothetical protein F4677DRAFT_416235 [Hypoxylon crocopeplum]
MVGLLGLPAEVLFEVLFQLQFDPPPLPIAEHHLPFFCWPYHIEITDDVHCEWAKRLFAVALVCRRLNHIADAALYNHVPLSVSSRDSRWFLRTSLETPDLGTLVRSVHIVARGWSQPAIDIRPLFWLPNITTLCISRLELMNAWELEDNDRSRMSTVRVLKLLKSAVAEEPLRQMLSWPSALREFWYDVNLYKWVEEDDDDDDDDNYDCESYDSGDKDEDEDENMYEDENEDEDENMYEGYEDVSNNQAERFSCEAVERAMSTQADSMERIVIAAEDEIEDALDRSVLDVSRYGKLKSLAINYLFLVGPDEAEVWRHLPPSLQELEVFYEDLGRIKFLGPHDPTPN